jgi:hypothetical protein
MIMIRKGDEVTFYVDDGETVVFHCMLPAGGLKMEDVERLRAHLLKLVAGQETGAS